MEHGDQPLGDLRWKATPDVVARRIRGEVLLVPIRKNSGALDGFFTLNPTAADIWTWAAQGRSAAEMAAALARAYMISESEAEGDVRRITDELVALGALQERP